MKRVIKYLGVALICGVLALILKTPSIRAYATVDFGTRVEVLDSDATAGNSLLQAGDIKVTVTVENNTGFSAGGFASCYSTSAFSLVYDGNTPLYDTGPVADALGGYLTYNDEAGRVSVGMACLDDTDLTGDFFYYYLRPLSSTYDYMTIGDDLFGIDVDSIRNESASPVPYTEPMTFEYTLPISYTVATPYTFMLGDVNGDGHVAVEDIQLILQLINSNGGNPLDVDGTYTVSSTTYPGLYISINGTPTLVLRVADVDFDGDIDEDDAYDVLAYYTEHIVSGAPYNGEIGEMQTHITYIIVFS